MDKLERIREVVERIIPQDRQATKTIPSKLGRFRDGYVTGHYDALVVIKELLDA